MNNIYKSETGKMEIQKAYKEILSVWPVENKQYEVKTEYGPTFVIESGEKNKPALLLLHGSVSNSFAWYGDTVPFSKEYHVYAVDIIGEAGLSAPNRPEYNSGAYARWLYSLLENLELKSCSIIGLSLGGWMALDFATTYPEKTDNLILLCPGGLAPENSSFIWKALFYSFFGKWGNKQIHKLINGGKLPDENTPGLDKALAFTSLINKHFNPRFGKLPIFGEESLSRLNMPVLLLFGDKDYLLSGKESIKNLKNRVPHAVTELLTDTGHIVINQTEKILGFLKK